MECRLCKRDQIVSKSLTFKWVTFLLLANVPLSKRSTYCWRLRPCRQRRLVKRNLVNRPWAYFRPTACISWGVFHRWRSRRSAPTRCWKLSHKLAHGLRKESNKCFNPVIDRYFFFYKSINCLSIQGMKSVSCAAKYLFNDWKNDSWQRSHLRDGNLNFWNLTKWY